MNTCFTVRNGDVKTENGIATTDCVEATSLYDNRELFYFKSNSQISTYTDNLCFYVEQLKELEHIKLMDC